MQLQCINQDRCPLHVDLRTPHNIPDVCLLMVIHFVSLAVQIYLGLRGKFPRGRCHLLPLVAFHHLR